MNTFKWTFPAMALALAAFVVVSNAPGQDDPPAPRPKRPKFDAEHPAPTALPEGKVTVARKRLIAGEAFDPSDETTKVQVILRYPRGKAGKLRVRKTRAGLRGRKIPGITRPGYAFRFGLRLPPGTPVEVVAVTRDETKREKSLGKFVISTDADVIETRESATPSTVTTPDDDRNDDNDLLDDGEGRDDSEGAMPETTELVDGE